MASGHTFHPTLPLLSIANAAFTIGARRIRADVGRSVMLLGDPISRSIGCDHVWTDAPSIPVRQGGDFGDAFVRAAGAGVGVVADDARVLDLTDTTAEASNGVR